MTAPTETIATIISQDLARTLREVVRSGEYPSEAAIVAEALVGWQRRRSEETERLRVLCEAGKASGVWGGLDVEALLTDLKAEYSGRRRA